MVASTSKEKILGGRRKKMAQTKVGKLLLEMFDRKINTVHGVKHMA